jgi:hypothetical protein
VSESAVRTSQLKWLGALIRLEMKDLAGVADAQKILTDVFKASDR